MPFIVDLKMQAYKINLKILAILFLCFIHPAFADNVCHIKGGGILDNLVTEFGNAAQGWQTQINPMAKKIFYALFTLEFMWQLSIKKVFSGDIEKLWVFFFTRTILGFFFAKYLVNPELYQAAIISIAKIGTNLGGYTLDLTPGNNFNSFGPSEIIGHFSCLSDTIHKLTDDTGVLQHITLKFTLAITQVVLLVILAFIAYSLMKVILQTYFLLYVGFFLTGFAGSSWTASYWEKYVQALSSMAIKFLSVSLIMGVLKTEMASWSNNINAANGDISGLAVVLLQILTSSLIMAFIIRDMPEWAASQLSGSLSLRYESATSSVASFMSGGGGKSSRASGGVIGATIEATSMSYGKSENNLSSRVNSTSPQMNAVESLNRTTTSSGRNSFEQAMRGKDRPSTKL